MKMLNLKILNPFCQKIIYLKSFILLQSNTLKDGITKETIMLRILEKLM